MLYKHTNGRQIVEVEGSTVGQCLRYLVRQFPELKLFDEGGKLFAHLRLHVNGRSADSELLEQPVKDGDELSIIFVLGGG